MSTSVRDTLSKIAKLMEEFETNIYLSSDAETEEVVKVLELINSSDNPSQAARELLCGMVTQSHVPKYAHPVRIARIAEHYKCSVPELLSKIAEAAHKKAPEQNWYKRLKNDT